MKLTRKEASQVYNILTHYAGARNDAHNKEDFFYSQAKGETEYRFIGNLGFGGKLWNNRGHIYVNCYTEDMTPEREQIINKVNILLKKFDKREFKS